MKDEEGPREAKRDKQRQNERPKMTKRGQKRSKEANEDLRG